METTMEIMESTNILLVLDNPLPIFLWWTSLMKHCKPASGGPDGDIRVLYQAPSCGPAVETGSLLQLVDQLMATCSTSTLPLVEELMETDSTSIPAVVESTTRLLLTDELGNTLQLH